MNYLKIYCYPTTEFKEHLLFSLILIVSISAISILGFFNHKLYSDNVFSVGHIRHNREYVRMLTSGLFHVDPGHLFFNMYTFFVFSEGIERLYSPGLVGLIFFASVLGGSFLSLAMNWKNPNYLAVGASGGVVGILYASIFLMEPRDIYFFMIPLPIPDRIFAVAYLIGSYFLMKKRVGNIGHDAHIGGALVGTISAIVVIPWILLTETKVLVFMFLPLAVLVLFDKFFWREHD